MIRSTRKYLISECFNTKVIGRVFFSDTANDSASPENPEEEFRVLNLRKHPRQTFGAQTWRKERSFSVATEMLPPRSKKMHVDQDWNSVWPTARTFHPATIPLPVRQGYVKPNKGRIIPDKFANAELMKIPNFLHLGPPAVKKSCKVLKEFCTKWPEGLETDEKCEKHFPIEVITTDYLHSSPTIRDPRARIVTFTFKLTSLTLDEHARDKFIRLVGERYDKKSDTVAIVADRCPLRGQNYDYLNYLLTVLHTESWKIESWEANKTEDDDERFFWHRSSNLKKIVGLVRNLKEANPNLNYISDLSENPTDDEILANKNVVDYSEKLTKLIDEDESVELLEEYKDSVLKLLRISS